MYRGARKSWGSGLPAGHELRYKVRWLASVGRRVVALSQGADEEESRSEIVGRCRTVSRDT